MAKKLYPEEAVQDIADSIRRINGSSDNYKISQMSGAIDDFDEEFARVDGYYENLTAGNAEQLLATKFTEDKTPYLFRSTGGTADVGNREYDTIIGGSVVWNQLVQTTDTSVTVTSGHKYYSKINGTTTIGQSNGTAIAINDGTKDNVIDLTQMFGTDIADYAYTLEQATEGSGIAWLKSQGFLTEDYIPYNTGEIKSVSGLVSHDMVGFNLFDEETVFTEQGFTKQDGAYYRTNLNQIGNPEIWTNDLGYAGSICFTMTYKYALSSGGVGLRPKFYYTDGTSSAGYPTATTSFATEHYVSSETKTVSSIRWDFGSSLNSTWVKDVCINLSWSGYRDGEYEPYVKHSYPLDNSITLRGIPKLSDDKIYYDGDVYNSDGSVTRNIYHYTFTGSESWVSGWSDSEKYYSNEYLLKNPQTASGTPIAWLGFGDNDHSAPVISDYGITSIPYNQLQTHYKEKAMCIAVDGRIGITKALYDDVSSLTGKTVYFIANEPTTESVEPFTNPQICDDFGTEEYVTDGIPVGHETKYPANLRDKLQHLPNLASADGDYIIRQSNNDMVLVSIPTTAEELPDAPTTDGTYKLTCAVNNGEVTYSWESEE